MPLPAPGRSAARLSWKASENGQTLTFPEGDYRVISYAFYRVDDQERRWSVSGSAAEGCAELVIEHEKDTTLDLVPELHGHLSAVRESESYKLAFFMTNEHEERMSIACNGQLVNPTWAIVDAEGKVVDHGPFEVT